MDTIQLTVDFPVAPRVIYEAWLDSRQHTAMTGSEATVSDKEGGAFTAWDGYITGTNATLTPYSQIVQHWRAGEFEEDHEDSKLVVDLLPTDEGCKVVLTHSNIPDDVDADYETGWEEYYFAPMQAYFSRFA